MLSQLVLPIHVPRAHRDPITSASAALAVFSLAIKRPLRPETFVLMMRQDHRGIGLFALETGEHLSLLIDDIFSRCVSHESAQAVVIASVRPQWPTQFDGADQPDGAGLHDGAAEFTDARENCHRAGIQLVDWFVIARARIWCPRSDAALPSLWHSQK